MNNLGPIEYFELAPVSDGPRLGPFDVTTSIMELRAEISVFLRYKNKCLVKRLRGKYRSAASYHWMKTKIL